MNHEFPHNLLVILGPTASGKTRLAAHLAYLLNGEIISADSRQVYRDMNIGTGKDYKEYVVNGTHIPTYLIDIMDAGTRYNLNQFSTDFDEAFQVIQLHKKLPVLCGGSGLYLQAALSDLVFTAIPINEVLRTELLQHDLALLKHIFNTLPKTAYTSLADLSTIKRVVRAIEICRHLIQHPQFVLKKTRHVKSFIIGLNPPLEVRRKKISDRLKSRLNNGLIAEVELLIKKGIEPAMFEYYGLEYKFVWRYLQGYITYQALFELLEIAIHQFAKRQMTWFRKMEKDGFHIHWLTNQHDTVEQMKECMVLLQEN
ncbi:MAG: tRNA (adenosine(37)-N6)-dimethylallyltransferase MiaA [Bacteroidia bacterium]|nr:tRNA (adenosine(37)-N6)-dimethylallyltransferase MiaA [Bacteroidia bacterium]